MGDVERLDQEGSLRPRVSVKIADRLERVRPYGERRVPLGPGVVWFFDPDLGTGLSFPIQRLGYRVKLTGPVGQVEAFLTYTNPTAQAQNATFLFALDRNVSPVKIKGSCGSRQFDTEVGPGPQDENEEDERLEVPDELCELFSQERENVLAIPLGEVPAGGEVNFQMLLAWMVDEVGEQGQGFSFRLPLMVSRALYTLNSKDLQQLELARGLERGAQVAVSIQIEASDLQPGRIACSQACAMVRDPNGDIAVKYDPRKPLEAKDFVLDYEVWSAGKPKAWLRSQGRHFLLNFFPPTTPPAGIPRRLVILVDGSEEMANVGANRCLECLSYLLESLDPQDNFALVAFNREVSGYRNGDFVEASTAGEALAWMKDYHFTGAADLKELLRRVVTLPRRADSVLSVVLITAGRLGNEPELYRLFQGSRDVLRLFPIMLGPRSDARFARAAARLTGGQSFRPLNPDSVSRAAERVLEHTRQPVLEGVGFQDKGLQYQGESLTPKYPSGLNWRRPITVMGAHTGREGLEAGGTAPGGVGWSEYVQLKPSFHKLLSNVWAHVKACELDDESAMLDRAERGILQNVIKNLSRDFALLNRYTALYIKGDEGVRMLPTIEARKWYARLSQDAARGRSANELLEEQKNQTGLKSGLSKQKTPGRGLRMKDALGSKSTTAIFGSKLGHRNKLSNSVKDGLFSKPMLKVRVVGEATPPDRTGFPGRDNGDAKHVASRDDRILNIREDVSEPFVESDIRDSDLVDIPAPDPISSIDIPMPVNEPEDDFRIPSIQPTIYIDEPEDEPDDYGAEISERKTIDLSSSSAPDLSSIEPELPTLRMGSELQGLPTIGQPPRMAKPEPPPIDIPELSKGSEIVRQREQAPISPVPRTSVERPPVSPPTEQPPISPPPQADVEPTPVSRSASSMDVPSRPKLPTPRELAAKVSAAARQGNQEELARNVLRGEPKLRQCLMAEMRILHSSIGETHEPERLAELTEAILFRLAEVAPKAELLVRAYGLGYQAVEQVNTDMEKAKEKLKFWLTRFAKLF